MSVKKTTFATMSDVQLQNFSNALTKSFYSTYADVDTAYTEALDMLKIAVLTNKERNHYKRLASSDEKFKSVFCSSLRATTQAARIDDAFTEYHTMTELCNLDILEDCSESRIKSHRSFLKNEFKHVCKETIHSDDVSKLTHKQRFCFELI